MAAADARTRPLHAVLVPGYWLGAWAWDDVVPRLTAGGVIPHAVDLPGTSPVLDAAARASVTFEDQVATVRSLVARLDGEVVLVGHAGAAPLVQVVLDHDPARIGRVVYIDAWPLSNGTSAELRLLAPDATELALPSWSEFDADGRIVAGVDEPGLSRFRRRSTPVPAQVVRAAVRVLDRNRLAVPVTVICCSVPSAELAKALHPGPPLYTELGEVADVTFVDLPTGHWPMFSRPGDLAAALAAAITGETTRGIAAHL